MKKNKSKIGFRVKRAKDELPDEYYNAIDRQAEDNLRQDKSSKPNLDYYDAHSTRDRINKRGNII